LGTKPEYLVLSPEITSDLGERQVDMLEFFLTEVVVMALWLRLRMAFLVRFRVLCMVPTANA